MLLKLLKSKIHRATVTRADLNYEGGFEALMRANPKTSGAGSPCLRPVRCSHQLPPIIAYVILPHLLHACCLQSLPRSESLIEVGNVFALIEDAARNPIVNLRR